MGKPTAFSSASLHLFDLVLTSLVLFAAVDRNLVAAQTHDFHILEVSSVLPDSVCDSSSQGQKLPTSSSLKVVHRHGPCHKRHKTDSPQSPSQILSHDKSRLDSINSRITSNSSVQNTFTSLAKPSRISCNAVKCKQLKPSGCLMTDCVYVVQYGDKSFTVGYLAKDKLTLSPTEIINDFYFGCGQNNQGLFGQTAGIIGLDRDTFSLISQTSKKYRKIFSYCLPSRSSRTGYLTFGKSVISNNIQYIPLANFKGFYSINIIGIYVGGQKLAISPTVFSTYGSIIDLGSVITYFPLEAYTALRDTFQKQMSAYPMASPLKTLDTCYDLSSYTGVSVPKISIEFGGNTIIDLDVTGIFYEVSSSQVCLAFATNTGITNVTVFGNVQQKKMQVVYDVAGGS